MKFWLIYNNNNTNDGYFQTPILKSCECFTRSWRKRGDGVIKYLHKCFSQTLHIYTSIHRRTVTSVAHTLSLPLSLLIPHTHTHTPHNTHTHTHTHTHITHHTHTYREQIRQIWANQILGSWRDRFLEHRLRDRFLEQTWRCLIC